MVRKRPIVAKKELLIASETYGQDGAHKNQSVIAS